MNNSRYILALDPSGAYKEGYGTTGWCLIDQDTKKVMKFGYIHAKNYSCQFQYWDAHIKLIDSLAGFHPDIVMEDYLLYGARANAQINSRLETPQLIGIIKYEAYKRGLFVYIQTALEVKIRWNDDVLVHKGIIQKDGRVYKIGPTIVSDHIRDSIRHGMHYMVYNSRYKGGHNDNRRTDYRPRTTRYRN